MDTRLIDRVDWPDHTILRSLLRRYEPHLEDVWGLVQSTLNEYAPEPRWMWARDLTFRHSVIYYAMLESIKVPDPRGFAAVPAAALLAYSIPMVEANLILDRKEQVLGSPRTDELPAMVTATGVVHRGYGLLAQVRSSADHIPLVSRVSEEILSAMLRDWAIRWDRSQLDVSAESVEQYWNDPRSRLQSSGIGRLMMGLALLDGECCDPDGLLELGSLLGLLRQVSDELLDVREDLVAGLVTLPVVMELATGSDSGRLRELVERSWSAPTEFERNSAVEAVVAQILKGDAPAAIEDRSRGVLARAERLASDGLARPGPVMELFRHRVLVQRRAVRLGLRDMRPVVSVAELLSRS